MEVYKRFNSKLPLYKAIEFPVGTMSYTQRKYFLIIRDKVK